MARKYTKRTEKKVVGQDPVVEEVVVKEEPVYTEMPRYGESYTSLILGILVVIISTALLLAFVHNRNTNPNIIKPDSTNSATNNGANGVGFVNRNQPNYQISTVPTLTPIVSQQENVAMGIPTATPTPVKAAPTAVKPPTVQPTKNVVTTPTTAPTKAPQPTVDPLNVGTQSNGTYTVRSGDTLWNIAERQYKDGYKWVELAKANKLANPGQISAGTKLTLPKIEDKKVAMNDQKKVTTPDEQNNKTVSPVQNKIAVGSNYKVVKGDCLWDIAQRAYGDGNKWPKIAQANTLANPSIIHSGNVFKIPRL